MYIEAMYIHTSQAKWLVHTYVMLYDTLEPLDKQNYLFLGSGIELAIPNVLSIAHNKAVILTEY